MSDEWGVLPWDEMLFGFGRPDKGQGCRFSPTCEEFPGCPDAVAEFAESIGGRIVRFMPLCRARAVARHGAEVVDRIDENPDEFYDLVVRASQQVAKQELTYWYEPVRGDRDSFHRLIDSTVVTEHRSYGIIPHEHGDGAFAKNQLRQFTLGEPDEVVLTFDRRADTLEVAEFAMRWMGPGTCEGFRVADGSRTFEKPFHWNDEIVPKINELGSRRRAKFRTCSECDTLLPPERFNASDKYCDGCAERNHDVRF